MTLYYSDRSFTKETISHFKKFFPRGIIESNTLKIERSSTIDEDLFLEYFDCALAKEHNLYKAVINLPEDLENKIPTWFVKTGGEIWVDPSGPKGKNIYGEKVFITRFNLYVNDHIIPKLPDSIGSPVDVALIGEFTEIRHALIEGNEEPIEIFRSLYGNGSNIEPKSRTAKYLASILSTPY